jgi:hypothetical protein
MANKANNAMTKIILSVHGLGLWYLTPLSTIFQLYRGGQFYWWHEKVLLLFTNSFIVILSICLRFSRKTNVKHNLIGY